jgi:hypothetical protein
MNMAYRAGVIIAFVTAFFTVWGTVVHDDGNGIGFFMVIMAAGVGACAAWFRADGMARTMAGVAVMQLCVGGLIATAPITALNPGGPVQALVFSGGLAALWLVSAACFFRAAKSGRHALAA